MRHIRRKDNPMAVVASGHVRLGGLGPFNSDVYEEVEGSPPREAVFEPVFPVGKQLDTLFMQQPVEIRVAFYTVKSAVMAALESADLEAAHLLIANAPVPDDLKPVQEQMLALLQREMAQASR